MKKLLLTSLTLILSITTTYATCDTVSNYKKTDTTISNGLIQTLINIGDKIVIKNPNKIDTYVTILTKIGEKPTLKTSQKEIVGVLREYFECRKDGNITNGIDLSSGVLIKSKYKSLHDYKDKSGDIGVKKQMENIDEYLKKSSSGQFGVNISMPYNAADNKNGFCTNGWYLGRAFVPPGLKVSIAFNSRPNTTFRIDYKYQAGIMNHSKISKKLSIDELLIDNTFLYNVNNGGVIAYGNELNSALNKNGTWLYYHVVGDTYHRTGESGLNPSLSIYLSYRYEMENKSEFESWLNNPDNFDINGEPYFLDINGDKQDRMIIKDNYCKVEKSNIGGKDCIITEPGTKFEYTTNFNLNKSCSLLK